MGNKEFESSINSFFIRLNIERKATYISAQCDL